MLNKTNRNTQSQIERAGNILISLRADVIPQDKEDAQKELNLGEATVTRYLNGYAKKINTALELIEFFQKRISDRERKLKSIEPVRA